MDFRWVVDEIATPSILMKPHQRRWLLDAVRKHRQVEHFRNCFSDAILPYTSLPQKQYCAIAMNTEHGKATPPQGATNSPFGVRTKSRRVPYRASLVS